MLHAGCCWCFQFSACTWGVWRIEEANWVETLPANGEYWTQCPGGLFLSRVLPEINLFMVLANLAIYGIRRRDLLCSLLTFSHFLSLLGTAPLGGVWQFFVVLSRRDSWCWGFSAWYSALMLPLSLHPPSIPILSPMELFESFSRLLILGWSSSIHTGFPVARLIGMGTTNCQTTQCIALSFAVMFYLTFHHFKRKNIQTESHARGVARGAWV